MVLPSCWRTAAFPGAVVLCNQAIIMRGGWTSDKSAEPRTFVGSGRLISVKDAWSRRCASRAYFLTGEAVSASPQRVPAAARGQQTSYRPPGLKSWFDHVEASGALITTNE